MWEESHITRALDFCAAEPMSQVLHDLYSSSDKSCANTVYRTGYGKSGPTLLVVIIKAGKASPVDRDLLQCFPPSISCLFYLQVHRNYNLSMSHPCLQNLVYVDSKSKGNRVYALKTPQVVILPVIFLTCFLGRFIVKHVRC